MYVKTLLVLTVISCTLLSQEVLNKDNYSTISTSFTGISYEAVLNKKHGIALGGDAFYWDKNLTYNIGIYYNFYFDKKSMKRKKTGKIIGTVFQRWGPFTKFRSLESNYFDEDKNKFRYSAQYLCIGLHYGKKRIFNWGITLDTRIGYGVPIEITEFKWKPYEPSQNARIFEKLTRVFIGMDYAANIGYSF